MDLSHIKKLVLGNNRFLQSFGMFHAAWASSDMTVDCLIGKLLKIPITETHILTSGMEFGRKARVLRDLLRRSDHPNKATLLGALNKLQNEAKRNAFAHSYIHSTETHVTFIERSAGGDYKVTLHKFTLDEFLKHVTSFIDSGKDFYVASGLSDQEMNDFAEAAHKAANN